MTTELYCQQCQKTFHIRVEDINLMLKHYEARFKIAPSYRFEYVESCFFKDLSKLKHLQRNLHGQQHPTMA